MAVPRASRSAVWAIRIAVWPWRPDLPCALLQMTGFRMRSTGSPTAFLPWYGRDQALSLGSTSYERYAGCCARSLDACLKTWLKSLYSLRLLATVYRSFHWLFAATSVRFAEPAITTHLARPARLKMNHLAWAMPWPPRHD